MQSYPELPEEIIFEILVRVPAKSVAQYLCLSKSWRAILSKPDFIKTHLELSKLNSLESLAIFGHSDRALEIYFAPLNTADKVKVTLSLTKRSFPSYGPMFRYIVYGSCDGLLLILVKYIRILLVINPVTGEIRKVPLSPFAIHPYGSTLLFGFGYDTLTNDYKIVIICKKCGTQHETFVIVYSLKNDSWKKLGNTPYDYTSVCRDPGPFVGGCLHWLDNKRAIVAFDLVSETFRDVPFPGLMPGNSLSYKVVALGGRLCMSNQQSTHWEHVTNNVWVMKEYGVPESWTKFTVSKGHGWMDCFLSGQEQVVLRRRNKCAVWNLKQRMLKDIVLVDNADWDTHRVEAGFVESLVSPHSRTVINDPDKE